MKTPAIHATFVLVVCLAATACGPHVDSASKRDIDQRIAALGYTGQVFPAPAAIAPKPLAIGQWTQYLLTNEKGEPSLITQKIVGEDAGAFWFEVANETYYGKTVSKVLVFPGDRMNPSTMDIRAVKMKDKDGRVSEVAGPMLQMMRSLWQGSVSMLAVSWQGLPQESMPVMAGTFNGCFKARTDASWGVWHSLATTWMHPVVPISGLVRSAGIDRPTSMELVGFGENGATSEIP